MKILLAVDGSPTSDAAVAEVARRPWPENSVVRLVTVDPPLTTGVFSGEAYQPAAFDEFIKQQRDEATRRLNAARATLQQQAPNLPVELVVLEGWPKDAILEDAEQWGANLIVVGSHGYGPIKRFFLGSVSLAIAVNAHCSVEIIRLPPAA